MLLLGGKLALIAALAAFQQFLSNTTSLTPVQKAAALPTVFYEEPERVAWAGTFVASMLFLLVGGCGYWVGTSLFSFPTVAPWLYSAGSLLVIATLLVMLRLYFAQWGRTRQAATSHPLLLPVLKAAHWVGSPFVFFMLPLQQLAGRTRVAFGTPSPSEELSHSLDHSPTEPASPQEKGLLKAIVNFSSITVRQIMRARADVIAIHRRVPFQSLLKQVKQCGYSRIPVYSQGTDKLDGILYVKDLLSYLNAPGDFVWQNLIRTPYFVPETKKIDELLREFQERRVHMAIVVNEYGETTGLITLEDVIEEIVGEIHDELDEEEDHYYTQLDERTFLFEGSTSLHDFCKVVDPPAELLKDIKGDVESVAGLMLRLFSRIPHTGEETQLGPYLFRIEAADSKKIKKVRVHEAVPHPHNEKE